MSHSDAPTFTGLTVNPDWKIVIIRSVWYPKLTSAMVESAVLTLKEAGIRPENIALMDAPGSFEIPLLADKVLPQADGVITFGIIVQGITHHARIVAEESARACMDVQLKAGKPVIYEILYVNSVDDAESRAIGPDSKGPIAARTLLTQLARLAELR